jgi:hypothetical protein
MSGYIFPDYLDIVLSFEYRGWRLQLDQSEWNGQTIYSVWADCQLATAVAIPCAYSRSEAIKRAKKWVDARIASE